MEFADNPFNVHDLLTNQNMTNIILLSPLLYEGCDNFVFYLEIAIIACANYSRTISSFYFKVGVTSTPFWQLLLIWDSCHKSNTDLPDWNVFVLMHA